VSDGADQALTFVYFIGILVLVGSGLAARRLPWGQTAKMVAAWVLIFAAAFAAFTLKDDFLALGRHILARSGSEAEAGANGTVRIARDEDGHFWVAGTVNGARGRFLVDSGATVTSLSVALAGAARLETSSTPVFVNTANGTVRAHTAIADRLEVGPIRRTGFPVHVAEAFGDLNVLGMNFLSSLRGWSVEGNVLVLKP
jgi:aspartyl protease family protein